MSDTPSSLDRAAAHRFFSAHCFNEAWVFLRKEALLPEDQRQLLARAHAACGQGASAVSWAEACLEYSRGEGPFYEGYAYEALARAAGVCGDPERAAMALAAARVCASQVSDAEERAMLVADLDTLG